MFTGIIECAGMVMLAHYFNGQKRLRIKPGKNLDINIGDSVAVNGVCLTVEGAISDWFEVYVSAESLRLTNLQKITGGALVNLERALFFGGRVGGHLVSGHVDGLARIIKILPAGNSKVVRFTFDNKFDKYFINKGSVALDGISLTISCCGAGYFTVNIIPQTQHLSTAAFWKVGAEVNLEIDSQVKCLQNNSGLDLNLLNKYGFLN